MLCKALEALGMLWEALGSIDVNMVCSLAGSWINHVSEDEGTFCIEYAFLQGLMNPAYGNVVISRSKLRTDDRKR